MKVRRVSWSVVVMVAASVAVVGAVAMPAVADPPPPGNIQGPPPPVLTNKLVNQATGLCAAPAGGSSAANADVVQYYCDVDPTRLWDTLVRPDGFQEIVNGTSGMCLSPAGGSAAAGTRIVQYYCDSDPARGWTASFDPAYGYQIVNEHSGLCLSGNAGGAVNADLVQTTCDKANTLGSWEFSGGEQIRNAHSSLEIDRQYPGGPNIVATQQVWGSYFHLAPDGTGYYTLLHTFDRLCLSPAGGSTAKNAAVVEYYCDEDLARHWRLVGSRGVYEIVNVKSGMCLSPAGGSAAAGAVIVQYYCDGDPSRSWTLVEDQFTGRG